MLVARRVTRFLLTNHILGVLKGYSEKLTVSGFGSPDLLLMEKTGRQVW